METWSNTSLLRAAVAGDPKASEIFCVRSLPRLYRYLHFKCRQRGVPLDLAADFTQETISRALQEIAPGGNADSSPLLKNPPGWLFTVGLNLIRDWKKKSGRGRRALARLRDLVQTHGSQKARR
jgi:DNA-directed RNA polymerase specialized sigma24 family protein